MELSFVPGQGQAEPAATKPKVIKKQAKKQSKEPEPKPVKFKIKVRTTELKRNQTLDQKAKDAINVWTQQYPDAAMQALCAATHQALRMERPRMEISLVDESGTNPSKWEVTSYGFYPNQRGEQEVSVRTTIGPERRVKRSMLQTTSSQQPIDVSGQLSAAHRNYRQNYYSALARAEFYVKPTEGRDKTFNNTIYEREMAAKIVVITDSFGGSYGANDLLHEDVTVRVNPGFSAERAGVVLRFTASTRKQQGYPDPQVYIVYAGINTLIKRESAGFRGKVKQLTDPEIYAAAQAYLREIRTIKLPDMKATILIVLPPEVVSEDTERGHAVGKFRECIRVELARPGAIDHFTRKEGHCTIHIVPFDNFKIILEDPSEVHPYPMQTPSFIVALEDAIHVAGHSGIRLMSEVQRAVALNLATYHEVLLRCLMDQQMGDDWRTKVARSYYDWQRNHVEGMYQVPRQPLENKADTPFGDPSLMPATSSKGLIQVLTSLQIALSTPRTMELPDPVDWPQAYHGAEAKLHDKGQYPHAGMMEQIVLELAREIPDTVRFYQTIQQPLDHLKPKCVNIEYARPKTGTEPTFVKVSQNLSPGDDPTIWTLWDQMPPHWRGGQVHADTSLMDHIVLINVHGYERFEGDVATRKSRAVQMPLDNDYDAGINTGIAIFLWQ
jgi:hypothetical protein